MASLTTAYNGACEHAITHQARMRRIRTQPHSHPRRTRTRTRTWHEHFGTGTLALWHVAPWHVTARIP